MFHVVVWVPAQLGRLSYLKTLPFFLLKINKNWEYFLKNPDSNFMSMSVHTRDGIALEPFCAFLSLWALAWHETEGKMALFYERIKSANHHPQVQEIIFTPEGLLCLKIYRRAFFLHRSIQSTITRYASFEFDITLEIDCHNLNRWEYNYVQKLADSIIDEVRSLHIW